MSDKAPASPEPRDGVPVETPAPGNFHRQRFESLTSMRFIAAACIVLLHAGGHFGLPSDMTMTGKAPWHQAVSFFFVLSGFVLSYVYPELKTPADRKQFLVARFARVWPGHIFATIVWVLVLLFVARAGIGKPFPFLCNLALVQAWVPLQLFINSGNIVSWSVSTEFGFYVAFPFLIASFRRTWALKLALTLGIAIALIAISQIFSLPYMSPRGITSNALLYMNPLGRMFEFTSGMVGALFWRRLEGRCRPGILVGTFIELAAFALVIFCATATGPVANFVGNRSGGGQPAALWLSCGGWMAIPFAILVVVLALGRGAISRALSWRGTVILGEASYSLYLLHWPLLALFLLTLEKSSVPPIVQLALFIATLLAASIAAWVYVETPFRKRILKRYAEKHAQERK